MLNNSSYKNNIAVAFFITFTYMVVEFYYSYISNSLVLFADASHMLTDSFALFIAWLAQYYSEKQEVRNRFCFGYIRAETIGALINSIFFIFIEIQILYYASQKLFAPPSLSYPESITYIAIIGLFVNIFSFFILNNKNNLNLKILRVFILSDMLSSIFAIFEGVLSQYFYFSNLDSWLAILLSIFILYNAYIVLRLSLSILLDKVPENIDIVKLKERLSRVSVIEKLYIWSPDGANIFGMIRVSSVIDRKGVENILDEYNIRDYVLDISID